MVAREKIDSVFLSHNSEHTIWKLNFVCYFIRSVFPERHEEDF